MAESANVSIRMDAWLKKQAEELFAELGLNMTVAMNMFLRQAIFEQGIPFIVTRSPNARTLAAIKEAESGVNTSRKFDNAHDAIAAMLAK